MNKHKLIFYEFTIDNKTLFLVFVTIYLGINSLLFDLIIIFIISKVLLSYSLLLTILT